MAGFSTGAVQVTNWCWCGMPLHQRWVRFALPDPFTPSSGVSRSAIAIRRFFSPWPSPLHYRPARSLPVPADNGLRCCCCLRRDADRADRKTTGSGIASLRAGMARVAVRGVVGPDVVGVGPVSAQRWRTTVVWAPHPTPPHYRVLPRVHRAQRTVQTAVESAY